MNGSTKRTLHGHDGCDCTAMWPHAKRVWLSQPLELRIGQVAWALLGLAVIATIAYGYYTGELPNDKF